MNLHYHFALLLIVLSCVFLTYANSEFRIINGVDWRIESSPYLVALNYSGWNVCVGSLITWKWVVTAAHCVINRDKNLFTIIAGVTDVRYLGVTGQRRFVEKMDYSREFTHESGTMDIGVIKVCQSFNPSSAVNTIEFCETPLTQGTAMRVSGWGFTTIYGRPSPRLRSTILRVFLFSVCRKRYSERRMSLTQTMICAAARGTDICDADSGAPGVVDGKLCAVTSHNVDCNHPYYPTIFTNIKNAGVQEFINSAIRESVA